MDLVAFIATAAELLAVRSTADRPADLHRALDFVVNFVGPGFTVERFSANGKPSALIYPGAGPRRRFRVILNAHLDVVPADERQFQPRVEGDRLHARGAQDMKVSALVLAQVFREVAAAMPDPVALQLVTDEEVGGRDGTGHQLDRGVTAAFAVIGEHSRLNVVADSKGLVHVRLAATGHGGHGAYPWLADNAAVKLLTSVRRLLERYPVPAAQAWCTTVNLARLDTPNRAFNQVPAAAEAWLDIRFTAGDTDLNGRTPREVAAFLSRFCEPGVAVEIDNHAAPHHAAHDGADVAALRRAAQAEGYPGEFLYKHGSGDGGFYSARSIPAVAFGVGGDGQHGPHEYAEIDTIGPYHRALTRFLTDLPPDPAREPTGPSHPRRPA